MTRRYERGSVVGFVLVGILLTAALVGGVWFARHPAGSSTQPASDTNTQKTTEESRDTTSTTTNKTTATTDEQLKETLAQQAAQSASQKATTSTTTTSSTTTSSSKLPTTGPADTLFEMIGVAMLSGVTVAYIRSRSIA